MTLHALSVDVEEYFQVEGLAGLVDRSEWDRLESRVAWQTDRLLDLFAREKVRATFFTLGWVARRHPASSDASSRRATSSPATATAMR